MPVVCWIMLNPSTADAHQDDSTIARVVAFSKMWRYGWAGVVNLFASRTRRPAGLRSTPDPVGPQNDTVIAERVLSAEDVVVAWGNQGTMENPLTGVPRCEEVRDLITSHGIESMCLAVTRSGQPSHPLYLPASSTLMPWRDLGPRSVSPYPERKYTRELGRPG